MKKEKQKQENKRNKEKKNLGNEEPQLDSAGKRRGLRQLWPRGTLQIHNGGHNVGGCVCVCVP